MAVWHAESARRNRKSSRISQERIDEMRRVVVTGIGAVTPVGNNVPEFWEAIKNGKNGIAPITRFDVSESKYKLAAEVKEFDPTKYMDKLTAKKLDRFVQFAMVAAGEAMTDSQLEGNIEKEDLAVYFGSGIGGFETLCESYDVLREKGPRRVSPLFIPKIINNIAAGNIAIHYQAQNACVAVSTACATGTTAIGEGYRAVLHGYTTAAICGGSEAAIVPLAVAGFGSCMALNASEDPNAASLVKAGFAEGTLAAAVSGTWNAGEIQASLGDNYAATKLPEFTLSNGETVQMGSMANFKIMGVNSETKNPLDAMALAEWLTNKDNQKLRFEKRSFAPTNVELANDTETMNSNIAIGALALQAQYATVQTSISQCQNYWTPAEAFGQEIIAGTCTKDNLQEKLDAYVNSVLATLG